MRNQDTLNILEVASTIQGEGKYNTYPVILVRFAGCNLRCSWCDTKYSWSFNGTASLPAKHLTAEELVANVVSAGYDSEYNIVLITGGEPMLWQYNRVFFEALNLLKDYGYLIHVETNGTIKAFKEMDELVNFYAVSPKQTEYKNSYKKEVLDSYRGVEHIWKFVVGGKEDAYNVVEFVKKFGLEYDDIYLMPEGVTVESLERSRSFITSEEGKEILKSLNYRMSERLQIEVGII